MYLSVLQVTFQNIFECFSFLCTCQQLFFCYSHQYCLLVTVSFLLCTLYFLCRGSTPVGVANFRTSPSYWMKLFQFSLDQFFGYKNFNLIIVKIWLSTIFLNHGTGPSYSYISLFGPSGTPSVGILLTHSHLRKCSNINSYMRRHVQQQQLKSHPCTQVHSPFTHLCTQTAFRDLLEVYSSILPTHPHPCAKNLCTI